MGYALTGPQLPLCVGPVLDMDTRISALVHVCVSLSQRSPGSGCVRERPCIPGTPGGQVHKCAKPAVEGMMQEPVPAPCCHTTDVTPSTVSKET